MSYELQRPLHVSDEMWSAIESYRLRFERACYSDDQPLVIGSAKDLLESIARSVLAATGETLSDGARFPALIDLAHKALKRQGGADVSQSQEIVTIANAARSIAVALAPLRNSVGNGHGRSKLMPIDEEMLTVSIDATMLWCRWALRRLGHLLAGYPNLLIDELQNYSSQRRLRAAFDGVFLATQPNEVQHQLGVVFGQSAGGGYGNARIVGVRSAVHGDLDQFPAEYRLGLAEGLLITPGGQIGLTPRSVPDFTRLLEPIPPNLAAARIDELAERAGTATWITQVRLVALSPLETLEELRREQGLLSAHVQKAMNRLRAAIDPAAPERQS